MLLVRFASLMVLAAALAISGSAQSTWIVNQNGSGNFTDLCAAIAAVAAGDTIVIQGGGVFAPCSSGYINVDRSLRIVADSPRPRLASVRTQVPGIELVLAGVQVASLECFWATLHGEDLVIESGARFNNSLGSLTDCRHRDLSPPGLQNLPVVVESNSDVVVSGCEFAGGPSISSWIGAFCVTPGPYQGLAVVWTSRAMITNTVLRGGPGGGTCVTPASPGSALLVAGGSTAMLTGCTLIANAAVPAIANQGQAANVVVDFGTTLGGPPSTVTFAAVPGLGGSGALPGAAMQCSLHTDPGRLAVIAAALGAQPPVSAPVGLIWLDLSQTVVLAFGFTDPSGAMLAAVPVPATVSRGLFLTAQGLTLSGSGLSTTTTPSVLVVR